MHKPFFKKEKLKESFQKIGEELNKPLTVFMFGGGAMAFRNQKQGTKDLDLVIQNQGEFRDFANALEKSGFHEIHKLEKPYQQMAASGIWENKEEFRLDVFVKTVCNALELTPSVEKRSELLEKFGNLTVKMFSSEDLILFKGITDRPADTEDVSTIIKSAKVNWDVVLEECTLQSKKRAWHGSLLNKINEIEEKDKLTIPITKELQKLSDRAILAQFYKDKREEGKRHEEILKELKARGFTESEINQLEKDLHTQNG